VTPHSLAFYVDVVTTGTLLGVGPADSPDRVAEVFGADFGENISGGRGMCRDYGLAEFHWDRASPGHPWSGHHFTLQVHRLAYRDRTLVSDALRARYGRFTPRLRFAELRRLLERRGVLLLEIPESPANAPYFRTFWQPDSRVAVSVIRAYGEYSTPDNLRVGDVYSVLAPMAAEEVEHRRARFG
jgi:predicted nucleic acid-binding protein